MERVKAKKRIPIWGVWVAGALLIALVFMTGVLDRPMTWEDMPYLRLTAG